MDHDRAAAIIQATFVTALWASSVVIIKGTLAGLDPLTFAAHRYALAAATLYAYARASGRLAPLTSEGRRICILLGVTGYALAQGGLYLGLSYLSAVTYSFILSLSPLFAVALGVFALGERPTPVQYGGILISMAGATAFFYGRGVLDSQPEGVLIALCSSAAWAAYHIILRKAGTRGIGHLELTVYPLSYGALILVISGAIMHPSVQAYSPRQALAILVLAIANTSCAFFLWTRAQSVLYAFEKTVLHNAILPFSAVFAYLALGEGASFGMCVGILLLFSGALLAQKRAPWEKP